MDLSLIYIVNGAAFRLLAFLRHWYIKSFTAISGSAVNTLERLDQTWALRITVRYFLHPLYGDYTIVGRILGIIFRTGRIIIAGFIYIFVILFYAAVYLVWIMIPPYIILKIFS